MIIYVDENTPPLLARGFNMLQIPVSTKSGAPIEVLSILDVFGQGKKDEDWIPELGKQDACVITQDYNINRIRHQRKLCEQFGLGMFYIRPPSSKGFSYYDLLRLFVERWPEIIKIISTEKRPFAYKIPVRGKIEKM